MQLVILMIRMPSELERIKEVYRSRIEKRLISKYSLLRPGELYIAQDRERALLRLLREAGIIDLVDRQILEVGCGRGFRLLDWLRWGVNPDYLTGIDIMRELVSEARMKIPSATLAVASGSQLPFADNSFDLVTQITVFSSILDDEMRRAVAADMWRVLRPGGAIVWYDFRVSNPKNANVRHVSRREVARLFPAGTLSGYLTTLAPPLARGLAPLSIIVCDLLAAFPFLRTHFAAIIRKSRE